MALSVFALGAPKIRRVVRRGRGGRTSPRRYGWRGACLDLGVPGIVLGVVCWSFSPFASPGAGKARLPERSGKGCLSEALAFLWRQRTQHVPTSSRESGVPF